MRYFVLLLLCVGCMEVDELDDIGEGVEKSLGREYLTREFLYIWHEKSVVILKLDYNQGSPEDDYLIGRDVCYW